MIYREPPPLVAKSETPAQAPVPVISRAFTDHDARVGIHVAQLIADLYGFEFYEVWGVMTRLPNWMLGLLDGAGGWVKLGDTVADILTSGEPRDRYLCATIH